MTPADLATLIKETATKVMESHDLDSSVLPETVTVERPRNPEHGDYATNVALQVAKKAGANPRELGGWLAESLAENDAIAEADIAGPGFLNIRLAADAQGEIVAQILRAGKEYGSNDSFAGKKVNLEFVSANPTGPIHLGGTRWAAVGDSLGRVLEASGAEVTREYYFNDHGGQIDRFSRSLVAAAKGEPTPEDGYGGAYIQDIAAAVVEKNPSALEGSDEEVQEAFRADGVEMMFAQIKQSLHEFGVDFDVYFHENSLFESGAVDAALDKLKAEGNMYEAENAWWLKSTDYGDSKDRVVVKSDGNAAYIAGDIAYVADKFDRGHDLNIYMLGADHHGYVPRLKAAAAALGYDADAVEGVMLKRRDAPYLPGRPKGPWWKWKRDPHIIDAVLMYAQRGHGKRSSYYSDYTFGVWTRGDAGDELVPVGKAYFGFTDEELLQIDRFVRRNTTEKFGPVRHVVHEPDQGLVLEVAFEGLQRSSRHKSGVAMRFPRISRLRWDKPPREADRLETLERMLISMTGS